MSKQLHAEHVISMDAIKQTNPSWVLRNVPLSLEKWLVGWLV